MDGRHERNEETPTWNYAFALRGDGERHGGRGRGAGSSSFNDAAVGLVVGSLGFALAT